MKRGVKFFSTFLVLVAMVTTVTPKTVESYATTEFTYAEQDSKQQVTQLELQPNATKDLCFIGVPDYYDYTCTWTSSNEEVATVDQWGVITAKAQGTTEIKLMIGDGSSYTSEPVVVTVISMNLTAGNSTNKAMNFVELKKETTLDLNFYGVTDWSDRKDAYLTEWLTSDASVVEVDQSNGMVTAVAEGTSILIFQIYDMEKDVLLNSMPVTIVVTK